VCTCVRVRRYVHQLLLVFFDMLRLGLLPQDDALTVRALKVRTPTSHRTPRTRARHAHAARPRAGPAGSTPSAPTHGRVQVVMRVLVELECRPREDAKRFRPGPVVDGVVRVKKVALRIAELALDMQVGHSASLGRHIVATPNRPSLLVLLVLLARPGQRRAHAACPVTS
jgi:hypothetical protein